MGVTSAITGWGSLEVPRNCREAGLAQAGPGVEKLLPVCSTSNSRITRLCPALAVAAIFARVLTVSECDRSWAYPPQTPDQ